ncbi:MAG: tRNA (adenosine(37)-N6)-threonylcarbamoyltransferase complex dimerization subunit type 1 TsaB [Acidobacteriota bacterium]
MAYILAFDTTGDAGSIALAKGESLIEEVPVAATEGFGHVLFEEIETLLARHQLTLREIACFATASGPGSFTGVRIGLTAAKGLAEATGRQVVAVSNLQALAWFGHGDLRAPYLDARRGEVYGAVYDAQLQLVQPEVVAKLENWTAGLPPGAQAYTQQAPLARAIAQIAWQRYEAGLGQDAADVDANYVRRADAELMWRDRD